MENEDTPGGQNKVILPDKEASKEIVLGKVRYYLTRRLARR